MDGHSDTDWLGSTRYLSDSTGNAFPSALRYDAFGNRTDASTPYDPSLFQFGADWGYQSLFSPGAEQGPGLLYLQQRYYDPWTGRFLSPDPAGYLTGPNLYAYLDNDPVGGVDPAGLAARGAAQLPDLVDAPDSELGGRGETFTARPFLRKASRLAGQGRQVIEFVGSFNEGANLALAGNDIGAHHYGSAFLRLLGPISEAFGGFFEEASGFFRLQNRPGRISLPGGGGEPLFDWRPARVGHIFRDAFGHVNPETAASQARFVRIFQRVAANPANLRSDAVAAGLIAPQAQAAGVRVYTQAFRNGEQVWVTVRNGVIENAGINLAGAHR